VKRKNELEAHPRYELITSFLGDGGIKVDFTKLSVGDKVTMEVG
jgi:hypothetical protein